MEKPIIPILVSPKDIEQSLPVWLADLLYIDAKGHSMQEVAHEIGKVINSL